MPHCKDKKKNNATNSSAESSTTVDRMYHDSETFLHRYRWWIVLILACMLGYYLYTRKCETEASGLTEISQPKLVGDLNLGDPTDVLNTEGRKLFRL